MTLLRIFGIDENVILINDDKDVKLFNQDLIDITLETRRSIRLERHHLILKMAIASLESRLLYVVFFDSYSMIGISEI